MYLLGFSRIARLFNAQPEHGRIGYEVNRSQKQTNSLGNSTEIPEPIVAQRYTVGYKLYKPPSPQAPKPQAQRSHFLHIGFWVRGSLFVPD